MHIVGFTHTHIRFYYASQFSHNIHINQQMSGKFIGYTYLINIPDKFQLISLLEILVITYLVV